MDDKISDKQRLNNCLTEIENLKINMESGWYRNRLAVIDNLAKLVIKYKK